MERRIDEDEGKELIRVHRSARSIRHNGQKNYMKMSNVIERINSWMQKSN